MPTEWMAIASDPSAAVTTTGLRLTPSVDRIATWGWLMIAPVNRVPKGPGLEMVNVPPVMSSADRFPERARSARSRISRAMARSRLAVGLVHDRHDEALEVEVDRDAQVDVVVDDQRAVAHRRVDVRELPDGVDHGQGDERQVGEAEALLGLERLAVAAPDLLDAARSRPRWS